MTDLKWDDEGQRAGSFTMASEPLAMRRMSRRKLCLSDRLLINLPRLRRRSLNECKIIEGDAEDLPVPIDYADRYVSAGSTYFKEFHKSLAQTIRCLLKDNCPCEVIHFRPQKDDPSKKFIVEVKDIGFHFTIIKTYDKNIWRRHEKYSNGDHFCPNYESSHFYSILVNITRWDCSFALFVEMLSCHGIGASDVKLKGSIL